MWLDFKEGEAGDLKSPTMVVSVSTSMAQYRPMYSQGRELGEYLLKKLKFDSIGEVRSSAFPPGVLVRGDGTSTLPTCSFYVNRGKHDLVLFAGDTSPMDDQHEFAEFILGHAKKLGVEELYSIGARWAENPLPPEAEPLVTGFSSDMTGVSKLRKSGVRVITDEPAPFFSSMVVAMSKDFGIRGYKLSVDHGEPSPHTRSVMKLLEILSDMGGFEVDLSDLRAKALPTAPANLSRGGAIYH